MDTKRYVAGIKTAKALGLTAKQLAAFRRRGFKVVNVNGKLCLRKAV